MKWVNCLHNINFVFFFFTSLICHLFFLVFLFLFVCFGSPQHYVAASTFDLAPKELLVLFRFFSFMIVFYQVFCFSFYLANGAFNFVEQEINLTWVIVWDNNNNYVSYKYKIQIK